MDPQEYDEIMRHLAAIQERMQARIQEGTHERIPRLDALIQRQEAILPCLKARIARLDAMNDRNRKGRQ